MDSNLHSVAMSVHQRLLTARRGHRRAEFQLAILLAEMDTGRLFEALGYASLANYGEVVLELNPRTARELALLGRRLPDLPVISAKLEGGELDWTKAREVVRVATPETEQAWVERAETVTCRTLEAEVANAMFGELPPEGPPDPARRPALQRMVFTMEAADAEVVRAAIAAMRSATHVGREELSDGALVAMMARTAMVAAEAELTAPESAPTGERFRVVLDHCGICRRTVSPDAEVSETIVGEAMCDAHVIDMRPGPNQGHLTRTVPEVTRRKVFHRAKWKCEVPQCRNKSWLDIHHMQARALGGTHDLENLASICCAHHRCIHDGTLAVELSGKGQARVIEVEYGDGRKARSG